MVNKTFTEDLSKAIKNSDLGGSRELTPGSVGRRYEPAGGVENHNKRIHKESKWVDDNKSLPFSFSKPKRAARRKVAKCQNCGHVKSVNINTVGVICSNCKQFAKVEEIDDQET